MNSTTHLTKHALSLNNQTKKRVDWVPLCKGANTNYGELLSVEEGYFVTGKTCTQSTIDCLPAAVLRLAPPADDKSNWQAYNGEDLSLLHKAGFVVQAKWSDNGGGFYVGSYHHHRDPLRTLAQYRVIAISAGFTDNPEEAK